MSDPVFAYQVARALEGWAPPHLAESYDNVGLLVGHPNTPLTGILVNLDMTEAVIHEAVEKGANMVVAHHPIWFAARKRLTGEDYVSRAIMTAIKHDILLYACHTNLDNVQHGVNARMGAQLGLQNLQFLRPKGTDTEAGSGMMGHFPKPMTPEDFLALVKERFRCGGIRYAKGNQLMIQKVAICGGAGSFLTRDALVAGLDAFITADITYHKFFDAEGKLYLLDIGHYESEQFTSDLIVSYLSEKFPIFAIQLSEAYTNPITYY